MLLAVIYLSRGRSTNAAALIRKPISQLVLLYYYSHFKVRWKTRARKTHQTQRMGIKWLGNITRLPKIIKMPAVYCAWCYSVNCKASNYGGAFEQSEGPKLPIVVLLSWHCALELCCRPKHLGWQQFWLLVRQQKRRASAGRVYSNCSTPSSRMSALVFFTVCEVWCFCTK